MSYLVFDLETVTDGWEPPADKPDMFPPPWACRVAVIAWASISDAFELVHCEANGCDTAGERGRLLDFSRKVQELRADEAKRNPKVASTGPVLVTFNGRGFDLPVLIARFFRHAVPMPWYLKDENKRKRYGVKSHLDLMDQIADYGAGRASKLDDLAKSIGLPGKIGTSGADVGRLIAEGKLDQVCTYGLDDVAQTACMLVRFRFLQGFIAPADLPGIETRLLAQFRAKGVLVPPVSSSSVPAQAEYEEKMRAMGLKKEAPPVIADDDFG